MVALQKQPLTQLQTKASSIDTKISTVGTLKSLMSTLKDSAKKLSDSSAWQLTTASSSNTAVAIKVTGAAAPGASEISVQQLARAQSLASANFAVANGATSAVFGAAGNLTITNSSDPSKTTGPIAITANMTLDQVAAAINQKSAASGVTASVLQDANGQRLVMRSKDSGATNAFTVSGDSVITDALGTTGASPSAVLQPAQNAKATVNGIAVESATNEFKKVLPGLSFTASQVTQAGAPAVVSVVSDTEGMKKNLQTFMDAYNALNDKLSELTKYDSESKTAGAMQGDSTIVGLLSGLRGVLSGSLGGINLSDLGIQLAKGGKLQFGTSTSDKAKLESVLQDPAKLAQMFSAEGEAGKPQTQGLAVRMYEFADKMLTFDTGLFDTKTKSLTQLKKDNEKAQDRVNDQAQLFEQRMRAQYAALDKKMGSYSGLSAYMSQQISQWNRG
ncbi:flagellar filament capping protein FliD [Comamonas testosteroni]|nr:flagellar filament capping protein FliD [Comamonas testosteroni]